MSRRQLLSALSKALLVIAVSLMFAHNAAAQSAYNVLYSFTGHADGGGVWDSVVSDTNGNLYATTSGGGDFGYGTVFQLTPTSHGPWTETVLHSFMFNDGAAPVGNLILDPAGNLYGTTPNGGAYQEGTVFELTPISGSWTLSVLHNFCTESNCSDGGVPYDGLVMDKAGNLYGTAYVAFELTPGSGGWSESVLYTFCSKPSCRDGSGPYAGVILDAAGNLYGTTTAGGNPLCTGGNGCGVVYELKPGSGGTWKEAVLHTFNGAPNDGAGSSKLLFDSSGNLYGTGGGGNHLCFGTSPCGAVYKMTRGANGRWQETVIYDFTGGATGNGPGNNSGLVIDQSGNLYGTAFYGGSTSCGCGVVYKLAPGSGGTWTYSVLHTFVGSDGAGPIASLILHNGKLYGTTVLGGSGGSGVVFELTP
jgi:uncharacterized repeat protein (TIGR03803 family)